MEFISSFALFVFGALILGDGLNIYLVLTLILYTYWMTGSASSLILIPASIFAIAGAIAGNGKRKVEFEKKKTSLTVPGK